MVEAVPVSSAARQPSMDKMDSKHVRNRSSDPQRVRGSNADHRLRYRPA